MYNLIVISLFIIIVDNDCYKYFICIIFSSKALELSVLLQKVIENFAMEMLNFYTHLNRDCE